jgi:flavodoxin
MKAVVVYQSLWGNTAAIARAIAEGIGEGARALSTAEATPAAIAGAGLIVAGAPVLGFSLPRESMLKMIAEGKTKYKTAPDVSQPSMRSWLDGLSAGKGCFAAFETRIWWSPGGSTGGIERGLEHAGYRRLDKARRFLVEGGEGPLRAGELEKAKAWGAELAQAMK